MVFDHMVRYNGRTYKAGEDVPMKEANSPASSVVAEKPKPQKKTTRKPKVSEK